MKSDYVNINLIGDIVLPLFKKYQNYDIDYIIKFLTPNSINIGNLESPILKSTPIKNPNEIKKKIVLFSLSESTKILSDLNIKIVSLANNHIFDFGYDGFKETLEILKNINIKWFGAGKNIFSSLKPLIIKSNNLKIGFIGMGWELIECVIADKKNYGVFPLKSKYLRIISSIKKYVDYLIVYVHWDYELERYPIPFHRELAHIMISFGADLICGSHPHRVQGIEEFSNKLIIYSLGNFILPQKEYIKGLRAPKYPKISNFSFILNLKISKNKEILTKIIPFKLINKKFLPLRDESMFLKLMNDLSLPLKLNSKEYYNYFKKNRKNNFLPILTNHENLNKILLKVNILRIWALKKLKNFRDLSKFVLKI